MRTLLFIVTFLGMFFIQRLSAYTNPGNIPIPEPSEMSETAGDSVIIFWHGITITQSGTNAHFVVNAALWLDKGEFSAPVYCVVCSAKNDVIFAVDQTPNDVRLPTPQRKIITDTMTWDFTGMSSYGHSGGGPTVWIALCYTASNGDIVALGSIEANKSGITTGVENIAVDDNGADSKPIYYSLTGLRTEKPQNGNFYIVVDGNHIDKIVYHE